MNRFSSRSLTGPMRKPENVPNFKKNLQSKKKEHINLADFKAHARKFMYNQPTIGHTRSVLLLLFIRDNHLFLPSCKPSFGFSAGVSPFKAMCGLTKLQ